MSMLVKPGKRASRRTEPDEDERPAEKRPRTAVRTGASSKFEAVDEPCALTAEEIEGSDVEIVLLRAPKEFDIASLDGARISSALLRRTEMTEEKLALQGVHLQRLPGSDAAQVMIMLPTAAHSVTRTVAGEDDEEQTVTRVSNLVPTRVTVGAHLHVTPTQVTPTLAPVELCARRPKEQRSGLKVQYLPIGYGSTGAAGEAVERPAVVAPADIMREAREKRAKHNKTHKHAKKAKKEKEVSEVE